MNIAYYMKILISAHKVIFKVVSLDLRGTKSILEIKLILLLLNQIS